MIHLSLTGYYFPDVYFFFTMGSTPPEKTMNPKISFTQAMFICGSISAMSGIIMQSYNMGGDRIC